MPWTIEKLFYPTTYLETKIIRNCASKISQELKIFQLSQQKPNLLLGTQISSHRVSKQPQQEGRKSQIWQHVDCKMSWQRRCNERLCCKESEKVPPKMFPRCWSFMYIVAKNLKEGSFTASIQNPDKTYTKWHGVSCPTNKSLSY